MKKAMKWLSVSLACVLMLAALTGCGSKDSSVPSSQDQVDKAEEQKKEESAGYQENISVIVEENTVMDAEELQKQLDDDSTAWSHMNKSTIKKVIKYMEKNNMKIMPGAYTISHDWNFKDGYFTVKAAGADGKMTTQKIEVLQFSQMPESK